ncbi:MAG: hypothetical protein ABEI54_01215 [Candidatus Bipolaricaulia bacterium]
MGKKDYLKELSSPRHGGRIEEVAEARGIEPDSLLDFSANMNPLAPPPGGKDCLEEYPGQLEIYPDDR